VPTSSRSIALPTEAIAAMQLARELCTARSIPAAFQKSPADVFMVMSLCQRYGFDFYPTIWECSLIRGRLFFSGKMVAAMLNVSGILAERLNYEYTGSGDELQVTVTARIAGETQQRSVPVKLRDVRTENENWKRNPEQQLSYAGARIWGRRHTPEILLGMMFEGETIDVTPTSVTERTLSSAIETELRKAGTPEQPTIPSPVPPAESAPPHTLSPPEDGVWRPWAQQLIAYVRTAQTVDAVDDWVDFNKHQLAELEQAEPKMWRLLDAAINEQYEERKARNDH